MGTRDASPRDMDILTLLIVGLVAGALASVIVGGVGYGILGDIVVGVVGAFLGTYVFIHAGWHAPFTGIASTIAVATIGAAILLVVLRLLHGAVGRRRLG
jgi:uncharacterized membrane protein YeaQ/YmgE (transglycosylase-associated protein family)